MGIDGDWSRDARRASSRRLWTLGAAVAVAALVFTSPPVRRALSVDTAPATTGPTETSTVASNTDGVVIYSESPSGSGTTLYPAVDPWRRYLADEATCPGGERTDLPPPRQMAIMLCLIDWARQQAGLNPLPQTSLLASTALAKADEIVRCKEFAHAACGREPDADVRAAGYAGTFGENLYIAGGAQGAPRVALDAWLNSPDHRENVFRAEWRVQGIALVKLPHFGPYDDMSLWVSHFGSQ